MTTFAGSTLSGSLNGTGASARFFRPQGIAVDGGGNVFVADTYNHTIRKITSAAVTSAVAGPGGNFGNADGTGANALFNRPRGIGIDRQGNVFVAESFNNTVRRITPAGVVSTFAGQPGVLAYADGTGSAARFGFPSGLTVDSSDTIFVTDTITTPCEASLPTRPCYVGRNSRHHHGRGRWTDQYRPDEFSAGRRGG